jgi:hypothetical protein
MKAAAGGHVAIAQILISRCGVAFEAFASGLSAL